MTFGRTVYVATGVLFLLLLMGIARFLHAERKAFHDWPIPVLLANSLVVTWVTFVCVPPDYRVLQDEATLTSTSFMMYREYAATTLFEARFDTKEPVFLSQAIDKRPPLFPFFSHLGHRLFGYSPSIPFKVNAGVFFALLSLIGSVFLRRYGVWTAMASQFLVAAQLAVFLSATSAGFDLFSTLFLMGSLAALGLAQETGRSDHFAFAGILLMGFSFTRYESLAIAMVVAGLAGFAGPRPSLVSAARREWRWFGISPAVFSPLMGILLLSRDPRFQEIPPGGSFFGVRYFVDHLKDLFIGLLRPPVYYPNQSVFWCLAVISGLVAGGLAWRRRKVCPIAPIIWIGLSAVLISLSFALALFFGSYTNPAALRLFLNFVVPMSTLPAVAFGLAACEFPRLRPLAPMAAVLAAAAFGFGITARDPGEVFAQVGATQDYTFSRDLLKRYEPASTVVVSCYPTNFSILGFSSIDFDTYLRNEALLARSKRSGKIREILIFQHIAETTGLARTEEALPSRITTHVLQETPISDRHRLRVSTPS